MHTHKHTRARARTYMESPQTSIARHAISSRVFLLQVPNYIILKKLIIFELRTIKNIQKFLRN